MTMRALRPLALLALAAALAAPAQAQNRVTTPQDHFGHEIGADYVLPNYQQLHAYWIRLANASDRMILDTIGVTAEGRQQIMAIISSPENLRSLDRYRGIARRMAKAEGVGEDEARRLAAEGKAVIWIDGGLHATEVLGAQQLTELVYRLNDGTDAETLRILDNVIILAIHANPDGHDLVADWYMRETDPLKRTTAGVPVLYQKYAGHDNNRDFYMSALAETTNMLRIQAREWFPQIIYNHHQTGPQGTVMFAPPFRDPPNHFLDPLIITGLDQVGSAMHQRFVRQGQGGTTMRSGASYSTWWNGGLRTTPYFKNQIGLLTETIGSPTPMQIPFIPGRQLPHGDLPLPVEPGPWHFRQSIEYSQTANFAVLDFASRNSDHLLFNIWRMGTNSIERGSRDHWTTTPREVQTASQGTRSDWEAALRRPEDKDARGFIIPSDQRDFLTAAKFVNALLKNGVDVHRATADFAVGGKRYPRGSYVVKTAQAFRPHVLDMFEAQDHPNDFAYPGGPPISPYDATGWTLAWQMGVAFDRLTEGFDGPFALITEDLVAPPAGTVAGAANAAGYLVDHLNDAVVAVNRVLRAGGKAHWFTGALRVDGKAFEPGAYYLETDRATVERLAREKGLSFHGVARRPTGTALELRPVKIGLWDQYGGSMPSGWTRMLLEDFEFDFEVVFPPELDSGNLSRFNVLLFEDGAIPESDGGGGGFGGGRGPALDESSLPAELRGRLGRVTVATTVPKILEFARGGGAVIALGSSANLALHLGLPITNHLLKDGAPLRPEEYFIPGTLIDMKVEHVSPVTTGMGTYAPVMFARTPTFRLGAGAEAQGVKKLGWYDSAEPLRSGWAWGQEHLKDGVGAMEVGYGQGKIFLYAPKLTFRAQPHGMFPLVFNAILYGTAR